MLTDVYLCDVEVCAVSDKGNKERTTFSKSSSEIVDEVIEFIDKEGADKMRTKAKITLGVLDFDAATNSVKANYTATLELQWVTKFLTYKLNTDYEPIQLIFVDIVKSYAKKNNLMPTRMK